jgi:midasin
MRPSGTSGNLFEWVDGSLGSSMKEGNIFLMDVISLAKDSVLERLNFLFEPGGVLSISEKPDYEVVHSVNEFCFIATMNPGDDFGKRELSSSLRNRLTEIWVPSTETDSNLIDNIRYHITSFQETNSEALYFTFLRFFQSLDHSFHHISLRDILNWVKFVDFRVLKGFCCSDSFIHGTMMFFVDSNPRLFRTY